MEIMQTLGGISGGRPTKKWEVKLTKSREQRHQQWRIFVSWGGSVTTGRASISVSRGSVFTQLSSRYGATYRQCHDDEIAADVKTRIGPPQVRWLAVYRPLEEQRPVPKGL